MFQVYLVGGFLTFRCPHSSHPAIGVAPYLGQDYPWGQQGGINAGLILLQPELGIFEQMKSEAAVKTRQNGRFDQQKSLEIKCCRI